MRTVLKWIIPLVITMIGALMAWGLMKTAPEVEKSEMVENVPVVEVVEAQRRSGEVKIAVRGRVRALYQTQLSSQVSAEVLEVGENFEAGGRVQQGELLLRLEAADYLAALASARSQLAQAELELSLEQTRSQQARREWEQLGQSGEPSDLTLRLPYLAQANAMVESAELAVERAQRDVARCELRAPFDARVVVVDAELGSVLQVGAVVAMLVPVDVFEAYLPVSVDQIDLIDTSSAPTVHLSAEGALRKYEWQSRIVRTLAEVEQETRSISLVAEIRADDYPQQAKYLVLPGLFVEGWLEGNLKGERIVVPRQAMVARDAVYVVDEKNGESTLQRREVDVDWTDEEHVFVRDGLQAGDRVVVTTLQRPVVGMRVDVESPAGKSD